MPVLSREDAALQSWTEFDSIRMAVAQLTWLL